MIELEAENAVLQQSLASLPQLQKDRIDLLDLKQSIQVIIQTHMFLSNAMYSHVDSKAYVYCPLQTVFLSKQNYFEHERLLLYSRCYRAVWDKLY